MRVLLIGGSGFIGRRVIARLRQRGHDVIVFHRSDPADNGLDVEHIQGNRLEIDRFAQPIKDAQPDAAIDFLPWNDSDTRRVIDVLEGVVERVVHLSSGDVYKAWGKFLSGEDGEPVPISEAAPLRENLYPYAGSRPGMEDYDKVLAEREVFKAHYERGYPGAIVRLPMVFGPGDTQNRTWEVVKRIQDGRPAILLGQDQAAWLWHRGYVDNVAFGIVLAAEREAAVGQAYNLGSPLTRTYLAWVRAIGDVMGWSGEVVTLPPHLLPEHLRSPYTYQQHILFDTSKVRRDLGFDELVGFEQALRLTVEWQVEHPPDHNPERFQYEAEDEALREVTQTA